MIEIKIEEIKEYGMARLKNKKLPFKRIFYIKIVQLKHIYTKIYNFLSS